MADRTYIYSVARRTPKPRSKRLRECGGGYAVSGGSYTATSSGSAGAAGADGFSPTITAQVEGTAVTFEVTNRTGVTTYRIDFGDAVGAAVENADSAAANANAAAAAANSAADGANQAATGADGAAVNANEAASSATSAAQTATDAAASATTAADSANQAAQSVGDAVSGAETAATNANGAADSANTAAQTASASAAGADSAATNANAAAQAAYDAIDALGDIAGIVPITDEEIDGLLKNFNFIDSFTVTAEGEYPLTLEAANSAEGADITGSVDISEIDDDDIRKAFENG